MSHERHLGKGFWITLAGVILLVCVGLSYYNDVLKKTYRHYGKWLEGSSQNAKNEF